MITISIHDTIHKLVSSHPSIKDIMVELGFKDIVKPGMIQTMGRIMTIKKGCLIKGIELTDVSETFKKHGFLLKEKSNERIY